MNGSDGGVAPMKNVFLDAGGVILDEASHETARAELTVAILNENGIRYSLTDYWTDIDEAVRVFALHTYGFVFWKNTKDRDLYEKLYSHYLERWKRLGAPLVLMDGLETVLTHLSRRYRVGILGQYGAALTASLEERGLLGYFSFSSTQDEYGITKPDPRYFERVLARHGADPAESWMVGDRIDKDINPAKMIGMKTARTRVGIYRLQEPRIPEEFADREVDGILGLMEAL